MSVMIVTSLGDLVIDLHTDRCPLTTKNFLKLCKIKYYNGCLFHTVQKDFTAQTGDPTGTGAGGDSVYKFLYGDQARFFGDEVHLDLKHTKMGTVAMASAGEGLNASQFYITLRDDLDYLDGKHTVFGEVAEGLDTLQRINDAYVDEKNRPYKNIRIKHTCILDDPFEDPPSLAELIPDASPEGKPKDEVDDDVRLEDDWVPLDEQLGTSELEEVLRSKEAHSRAVVLESIGDIPDAEMKPPDTVLFVCKLNPVTEDEDLHTIFSRFGTVTSAEIIRDFKTGDSLCFAFIEFENKDSCEQAYFKMDNALIDDRRIHVDFSQSVAKLWSQYRRKDGAKGKGCFKCGAPDHMAKDCDGDSSNRQQQPSKYTLKDDNTQRGADRNSRYDMVFDEDTPGSPQKEKRRQDSGREEGHNKKQKVERRSSGDVKQKDHERDSRDRNRHSDRHVEDRRKEDRDSERNRESRPNQSSGSRRDSDYPRERRDRERERERDRDRYSDKHDKKVDEYSKRKSDGDRDYRKRSSEKDDRGGARREDGGRRRASDEDDGRYKRDELRNRKENADGDGRKEKREDRDDGRRSRESGRSCDRDYDRRRHGDGRR